MLPDPIWNGFVGGSAGTMPNPTHVPSGTQMHVCLVGSSGKYGIGAGRG